MGPILEIAELLKLIDSQGKIFQILVLLSFQVIFDKLVPLSWQYFDPDKVLAVASKEGNHQWITTSPQIANIDKILFKLYKKGVINLIDVGVLSLIVVYKILNPVSCGDVVIFKGDVAHLSFILPHDIVKIF